MVDVVGRMAPPVWKASFTAPHHTALMPAAGTHIRAPNGTAHNYRALPQIRAIRIREILLCAPATGCRRDEYDVFPGRVACACSRGDFEPGVHFGLLAPEHDDGVAL